MSIVAADDWISGLSATLRHDVLGSMSVQTYTAGDEIQTAGATAAGMLRIEVGHARLLTPRADGRQSLLCVLAPGACLGEAALLAGRPFNNTAVAIGDASVMRLPKRAFLRLYGEHRELADALCRKFARSIAWQACDRQRRAQHRIGVRVALALVELAETCGVPASQGVKVPLPVTQTDIAEHLDVTRQSVQLEVSALRRAGIVRKLSGEWLVTNLDLLRRLARQG